MKVIVRPFVFLGRTFRAAFREFRRDDCFTLASSISYVFLLSMIPFSTIGVYLLGLAQQLIVHQGWAPEMVEMFAGEIVELIPFVSKEWVKTYLIYPSDLASFRTVNFVLLPIVCGMIFKTLESSYRRIFGLPARHLILSQAAYALLSIFTVVFLFVLNFSWSILAPSSATILKAVQGNPYFQPMLSLLHNNFWVHLPVKGINASSIVILLLFYIVTVKIFLGIKIRKRYQIISAFLFCTLWLLARGVFSTYVHHISKLSIVYGSLTSIVLILMWVFYSSLVLLFSIEILHALHVRIYRRAPIRVQRDAVPAENHRQNTRRYFG